MGHRNSGYAYNLNETQLKESAVEKDLGVYVSSDFKPAHHIAVAAAKGNRIVGLINRIFSNMDLDSCITFYCSLVGPHLEYAMQNWSLYYRKILMNLKKFKEECQNLCLLKDVSYEDRCGQLGLITLEKKEDNEI